MHIEYITSYTTNQTYRLVYSMAEIDNVIVVQRRQAVVKCKKEIQYESQCCTLLKTRCIDMDPFDILYLKCCDRFKL